MSHEILPRPHDDRRPDLAPQPVEKTRSLSLTNGFTPPSSLGPWRLSCEPLRGQLRWPAYGSSLFLPCRPCPSEEFHVSTGAWRLRPFFQHPSRICDGSYLFLLACRPPAIRCTLCTSDFFLSAQAARFSKFPVISQAYSCPSQVSLRTFLGNLPNRSRAFCRQTRSCIVLSFPLLFH